MILSEEDYFQKIQSLIPNEGEVTSEVLELLEKALVDYPDDAQFWWCRGELILISSDDGNYELEDVLKSYERALEIDPLYAEAYESIGYYEDGFMNNKTSAENQYRKAIELGAGEESYYGLARVLARLNRATEALEVISPENCPYYEMKEIQELKTEIEEGFWNDGSE